MVSKLGFPVILFSWFLGLTAATAAYAQPIPILQCQDPSLQAIVAKLDDRADRLKGQKELNLANYKDRDSAHWKGAACTYAATAVVVAGLTFVGGAGGLKLGLMVAPVLEGDLYAMLGTGLGEILFTSGGIYAFKSIGGKPAAYLIDAYSLKLEGGYTPTAPQVDQAVGDVLGKFEAAYLEIGRLSMAKEADIVRDGAWYHLGWDEKRVMDNMLEEAKAFDAVYTNEQLFIEKARAGVMELCTSG